MSEATPAPPATPARRSDAGAVRLTGRDIAGLVWCGEMHGVPYDLLASLLAVRDDRLRAITGRWRRAGYAQTARLGPGPAWCWLARPGLAAAGLDLPPTPPSLGRLAHLRAVMSWITWCTSSAALCGYARIEAGLLSRS